MTFAIQRAVAIAGMTSGVALAFAVASASGLAGYLGASTAIAVTMPALLRGRCPVSDIVSVTVGTAVCWMVHSSGTATILEDAKCVAVLCSLLVLQAGVTTFCGGLSMGRDLIAAWISVATLTWLGWPLWLESAPALLIRCHPLMAMNGVLAPRLGVWTEQPVAYRIMSLGQDVSYTLPTTIWPATVSHVGVGILAWSLGRQLIRRRAPVLIKA